MSRPAKDWIQVWTGGKFYPLNPDSFHVRSRDIARALSMTCRYGGHVKRFYSVAEHAVRVARRVLELTGDLVLAYRALHHDDTEAYLGDVCRPVKYQPEMYSYRSAEKELNRVLMSWHGCPVAEPEIVSSTDREILGTEARQLKSPVHPDWKIADSIPNSGRLGWIPARAEAEYLWLDQELRWRQVLPPPSHRFPRVRRFTFVARHVLGCLVRGEI